MSEIHFFLIFMGLAVLYAVISNILNPPQTLTWAELPPDIASAVHRLFPGFEATTIKWIPTQREYKMTGQHQAQSCKLEVDVTKDGDIKEFEYKNLELGHFKGSGIGKYANVPAEVRTTLQSFMTAEQYTHFKPRVISKGTANNQPAYSINARMDRVSWEFEILEDGRLLELEIESTKGVALKI